MTSTPVEGNPTDLPSNRAAVPLPAEGRGRVFVSRISPRVEHGRFATKRVVGDRLLVRADLVADGHDVVAGVLRYRAPGKAHWDEAPLLSRGNDRFEVEIALDHVGRWDLAVEGWVDPFASWRVGLVRKSDAGSVEEVDLAVGAELLQRAAERAEPIERNRLSAVASRLTDTALALGERTEHALAEDLPALVARHVDRACGTRSEPWQLRVDPVHARFAAWYELFPRSTGEDGVHGTFVTLESRLPHIRDLGFDVVYLPPIHPIGTTFRKGPNNTLHAGPEDPGSPWAIGGKGGGHTAINPALGTLDDFDRFARRAAESGLRVALDVAFQASPDHPWVQEHPGWFKRRPDGSIQYAENPPKKYQDVYPFDFECADWRALWEALADVFRFWIRRGITIFRVDNPHTKPIQFWRWCIETLQAEHPEVTFLAKAFTRPQLKYALAKIGFSQGYTYFTWRSSKQGLVDYLSELTATDVVEYFRPSLWPNTPDILPEDLQYGGRPAFLARLVLAATLSSHYGVYGPPYEHEEHVARPGSGEYDRSEKYELRHWDRVQESPVRRAMAALNAIRRAHPALQRNETLRFHPTDNEMMLCYSKRWEDDVVLVVVSLDFHHRQSGWVSLDLERLGVAVSEDFQVHDLLGGGRYRWRGARNYVEIDPRAMPAQVFAIRRRARTERDFDYYL